MKVNITFDIEANVGAFIIPNGITRAIDYGALVERRTDEIRSMLQLNGFGGEDPSLTPLVQIWWHSDVANLDSDNLVDHGFSLLKVGEQKSQSFYNREVFKNGIHVPMNFLYVVPCVFFKGMEEGDRRTFKFSHNYKEWLQKSDEIGEVIGNFTLHTTVRQDGYRYARFGPFEKTLNKLMTSAGVEM